MNLLKLLASVFLLVLASGFATAQDAGDAADLEPAVSFDTEAETAAERPQPPATPEPAEPEPVEPAATSFETMDHLNLDATSVTGNRELPKVLYIVPWKKSDLGDLRGRPVNSLLDEVLSPVDREEFQRHLQYYGDVRTE